jgi:hypothetical protein
MKGGKQILLPLKKKERKLKILLTYIRKLKNVYVGMYAHLIKGVQIYFPRDA